jgi:PAS domain S-box-containing protein
MTNSPTQTGTHSKDHAVRRVLGVFMLITVVLAGVAVSSVVNINRSAAASDWVNHTHAVILEVNGVLASLQAGEGASFAYAVTGDPRSAAESRIAFARLDEHLELSKALTRAEPAQHEQVLRVEAMATQRAEFYREILTAKRLDKGQALRELLSGSSAMLAFGEIQAAVDKLTAEEMALLAERDRISYRQAQATRWTVWCGVSVDVLLIVGVAWLIWDDIRARRRAATMLEEANAVLEQKVRERTVELVSANEKLRAENLERRWANQGLDHQLRYNQLIINSISDLVFVITKATNISRINPAVVHLTGYEPTDLVSRPFIVVARDADSPAGPPLGDAMARSLEEGREMRERPVLVQTKSGGSVPMRLALFPLRDRDRVVGGVVILGLEQTRG